MSMNLGKYGCDPSYVKNLQCRSNLKKHFILDPVQINAPLLF